MTEKALEILLNISGNVNTAARLACGQRQFYSKDFTSLVCTSYQQTPQNECFYKFRALNRDVLTLRAGKKPTQEKKNRYLDRLTVYKHHHFLAELQKPSRWRTQRSKNHEYTNSSVVQKL